MIHGFSERQKYVHNPLRFPPVLKNALHAVAFLAMSFCLSILLSGTKAFPQSERMSVVFLNPDNEANSFWKMTTDFLLAAAEDLNVDVEVIHSNYNHIHVVEQAREVLAREKKPDYLLTGNEKGAAGKIIELAEREQVDVFVFNNGFITQEDIQKYGKPREKYSHWIGQLIPDNHQAGYLIAKHLIAEAQSKGLYSSDGKIKLAALAGTFYTHASLERVRGLKEAVQEHADRVELLQVVPGDWSEETAILTSRLMYSRHQEISAVWAVNDATAFGAMKSAIQIGKVPGRDIIFGGCNWQLSAIEKVQDRSMSTTVGGHFMDGAWSLVMLYDYHNNIDIIHDGWTSSMSKIDRSNATDYLQHLRSGEWGKIDFRQFSKALNPDLVNYDFSIDSVLGQFK